MLGRETLHRPKIVDIYFVYINKYLGEYANRQL